jgi:hypothetical protein
MKKKIQNLFIILFSLISSYGYTQVKKLNDPSIVAHNKRMVFESWGDWRPYPKYFLGIQTNFAYATVWGNWAPSRNRDYKNGEDIRPLKPTGLEVQRLAELELQRKEAEKIKIEVDTLYKRNVQDFAHWTSATVDADPLWLLYYKRMLKPLKEFPENPQSYIEWRLKDEETYQNMIATGEIESLQIELELLKDKYNNSRTFDIPRGKRFLMYHESLIGWRKFINKIRSKDTKNSLFLEYKKLLKAVTFGFSEEKRKTDIEIVRQIMDKYNNQF